MSREGETSGKPKRGKGIPTVAIPQPCMHEELAKKSRKGGN